MLKENYNLNKKKKLTIYTDTQISPLFISKRQRRDTWVCVEEVTWDKK